MPNEFHPLRVKAESGEPYFQLPTPHENIIITPPRLRDAPFIPPLLNDPRVYPWLKGPPHPYLPEHAHTWLSMTKDASDAILRDLEDTKTASSPVSQYVDGCPVRTIREVKDDGTEVFLGDIGFQRTLWLPLSESGNTQELQRLVQENIAKKTGDPSIIWTVGDYLAPSHHGKGIMSAALYFILHQWAIPRMGVRRVIVTAHEGNLGSVRVFQKNGFVLRETTEDFIEVRGVKRGLHILDWEWPSLSTHSH